MTNHSSSWCLNVLVGSISSGRQTDLRADFEIITIQPDVYTQEVFDTDTFGLAQLPTSLSVIDVMGRAVCRAFDIGLLL